VELVILRTVEVIAGGVLVGPDPTPMFFDIIAGELPSAM